MMIMKRSRMTTASTTSKTLTISVEDILEYLENETSDSGNSNGNLY